MFARFGQRISWQCLTVALIAACASVESPAFGVSDTAHQMAFVGYGFGARWASMVAGGALVDQIKEFRATEDLPADASFIERLGRSSLDLGQTLMGVNVSILLWMLALRAYERMVSLKVDARGTRSESLFNLAHQSGHDAYWIWVTFCTLKKAVDTLYAMPAFKYQLAAAQRGEEVSLEQYDPVIDSLSIAGEVNTDLLKSVASLLLGLVAGYSSFQTGFQVAKRVTNNVTLLLIIIFDVGITLSAISRSAIFAAGEQLGLLNDCYLCQDAYQLGDDAWYVLTDCIGNWIKLLQQKVDVVHLHAD